MSLAGEETLAWDGVSAACWLGVNLLLAHAAYRLSRRLYPEDGLRPVVLHSLVTCWALIVAVTTALGIAGVLTGYTLLTGVAVIAGGLTWGSYRTGAASGQGRPLLPGDGLMPARLGHQLSPPLADEGEQSGRQPRADRGLRAWPLLWGFLAAVGAGHVVLGLLRFPAGWDTLMYHLPLIDHWLQARSLYAPDCGHWSMPANNELVGLWIVAPFSGDFLIGLSNVPAVLLLVLGTWELATNLGLSRTCAQLVALAVVANQVVWQQLVRVENDVAVAGLFVSSVAYGLRYSRQGSPINLAFAAVSMGLLAGVKFYALGYAVVAWALTALVTVCSHGRIHGLCAAGLGGVGLILWGGYWYVRNMIVTGSPLYPKGLTLTDDVMSQIYPGSLWETSLLGNGRPEVFPLAVEATWNMTGPCQLVALLGLPVCLIGLVATSLYLYRRPGGRMDGVGRLGLSLSLVGSGLVLLVTPFAVEDAPGTLNAIREGHTPVRYGLTFLSLAVVGLAVVLQDLSRLVLCWCAAGTLPPGEGLLAASRGGIRATFSLLVSHALPAAFLCAIAFQLALLYTRNEGEVLDSLLIAGTILMTAWGLYALWAALPRTRRVMASLLSIALPLATAMTTVWLGQRWHEGFASHYDTQMVTANGAFATLAAGHRPQTRICVVFPLPYIFFGSNRQWQVCEPTYVPSPAWLLRYLRQQNANLIVTWSMQAPAAKAPRRNRWVAQWVREHPQLFVPLDEGGIVSLYHVKLDAPLGRVRGEGAVAWHQRPVVERLDKDVAPSGRRGVPRPFPQGKTPLQPWLPSWEAGAARRGGPRLPRRPPVAGWGRQRLREPTPATPPPTATGQTIPGPCLVAGEGYDL